MPKYAKMTRSEWFKYGSDRLVTLRDAISSSNPVSGIDGKDLLIKNSEENLSTIDSYIKDRGPTPTFQLQLKDGKTVLSNVIGKSPLFGGKGAGQGATGNTSAGESLQCLYLAAMLGEPAGTKKEFSYFTPNLLKNYINKIKVDISFERMIGIAPEWHYSAYESGKYLIQNGYVTKDHVLHRGSTDMKKIYRMKNNAFKKSGRTLNDDKWNPGDIWAIDKSIKVEDVLDDSSIEALNGSILRLFKERKIVGISLKQISKLGKPAKLEEYNTTDKVDLEPHVFKEVRLQSPRSTFWNSKMGMVFFDQNEKAELRATRSIGAINMEIRGSGARGGRVGYGEIQYAAKIYLDTDLKSNSVLYTDTLKLNTKPTQHILAREFFKMAQLIHPEISESEWMKGLETSKEDSIHANLGITYIAHAIMKSKQEARDKFITHLVNYAGSKLPISSAYVKISAR